ncbi:T-complex protein 11-like protein 1 isoform X2 [Eupeodes corollae]|nr:T-complex protein 11-like protein 1 isoform X2 [Eupeodes corollae]XP_055910313.1 T-complex protein 11-like protein 1 isoform X2 [Eupeodes corollae]
MDSNSSTNEGKNMEHILSSSPVATSMRLRTDSEGSDQARFILPSTDGSPPKVVTLNELTHVVNNIENMSLVHEIAVNPEFKFEPYEAPENSLERRIKEVMHKVFWDILREQLNLDPPNFDHAIQLLADIKDCFPQIIPSSNKRALEHINEVLDASVIRQQAEQGVLDFKSYANFVITIMAKSCAPARDEQVQKLTEIDDVVETFKGILETMTVMKLDMTNYMLNSARNDILANSVEYEKAKFKEYLEYYKFGFPCTDSWLRRNQVQAQTGNLLSPDQTIYNAYMELMNWSDPDTFPEVLSVDKDRILKLGQRAKQLCASASLISICSAIPIISQRTANRTTLAKQIEILLQSVSNEKELSEAIKNIWVHIKSFINTKLSEEGDNEMDATAESTLKTQILQIGNTDSPVYNLLWKRIHTYFRLVLGSKSGTPPPPPGYTDYQDELQAFAVALRRVILYNHSVFGDYFLQVLTNQRPGAGTSSSNSDSLPSTSAANPSTEPSSQNKDEETKME